MQKVKLNIVPKGVKRTTYLSQNDNGRVVRYELFNELVPYTLDGSETITLTVVRPDGEEIVSNVPNTEEAYIDVTFNDDMSAIAGVGAGEIKITDGETVLGSHNFDINVEIDAYNGRDVVIETETGTLLSFNTEVEDNALEYESEIPYNSEGYTGLEIVNSRTAPAYDKTPYLFRKTPSGYGNSCKEKIIGASVAFNQLLPDAYKDFTNTTTDSRSLYLVIRKSTTPYTSLYADSILQAGVLNVILSASFTDYIQILHSGTQRNIDIIPANVLSVFFGHKYFISLKMEGIDTTTAGGLIVKNIECIDLTAFFGSSTIADYLYNLETQTAGAGVQKFKELGFDKPYYPYNAGSLMSSKPLSKKVVGKNLLDNNKIVVAPSPYSSMSFNNAIRLPAGVYSISLQNITVITSWRYAINLYNANGSNILKPITNGIVRFLNITDVFADYYNDDKTCLNASNTTDTTFTMELLQDTFVEFALGYGDISSTERTFNLQVELGSNVTPYEPYSETTYNLGGDELRGLLKLDANNNIFAYGDIKTSDGKIKRILKELNLTSQNWSNITSLSDYAYIMLTDRKSGSNIAYFANLPSSILRSRMNDANQGYVLEFVAGTFNSTEELKTALSNSKLIYELATPTIEESTPFDNPQEVKVTEEFIDERATPIPVGHDTLYGTDIELTDIDFDTTIYGGNIDAINGVLTSRYNSDGSVKTTPDIIDVTPTPIPVRAGDNNIFNSADGDQTIRYYNQVEE